MVWILNEWVWIAKRSVLIVTVQPHTEPNAYALCTLSTVNCRSRSSLFSARRFFLLLFCVTLTMHFYLYFVYIVSTAHSFYSYVQYELNTLRAFVSAMHFFNAIPFVSICVVCCSSSILKSVFFSVSLAVELFLLRLYSCTSPFNAVLLLVFLHARIYIHILFIFIYRFHFTQLLLCCLHTYFFALFSCVVEWLLLLLFTLALFFRASTFLEKCVMRSRNVSGTRHHHAFVVVVFIEQPFAILDRRYEATLYCVNDITLILSGEQNSMSSVRSNQ